MAFLVEFDFEIKHIKVKEKKIKNDLSRHEHAVMKISLSSATKYFVEQIKISIQEDENYLKIQQVDILDYVENLEKKLTYRNKLYVPNISSLKHMILD